MIHRFIPFSDGDVLSRRLKPEHALAIKRWTRKILRLDEDTVVTVSELACSDPSCSLVETVIAVFDEHTTCKWKLTRPNVAVTKMMVQQTLATPPAPAAPTETKS